MASFSISSAAFTGLGIVRQRPVVFGVWLLINLVVGMGSSIFMVASTGPALSQFQALSTPGAHGNPAAVIAVWRSLGPFYGFLFLFGLVYYPVVYATIDRAVLQPTRSSFAYLRLGADELRQLGLFLLSFVVGIGVYIALIIVVSLIAIIGMLALHGAPPALGVLAMVVGIAAFVCGLVFIGVRLSLASPVTFATRRVDLFSSWRLTKGRFWAVFATYIVAGLLTMLIYLVGLVVIGALMAASGVANIVGFMFHPNISSLSAFISPLRVIYLALHAILSTLAWPMLIGPPAAIYKALATPLDGVIGDHESIDTIFS